MSNIEQGLPAFGSAKGDQGISNDEVRSLVLLPSAFLIRYSTCPLCPQTDFIYVSSTPESIAASVATQSTPQGRRVFCGSLLSSDTACGEVTG
jgi:hypothetical protein